MFLQHLACSTPGPQCAHLVRKKKKKKDPNYLTPFPLGGMGKLPWEERMLEKKKWLLSLPVHHLNLKSSDEDICGGGGSGEEGAFPELLTLSAYDLRAHRQ